MSASRDKVWRRGGAELKGLAAILILLVAVGVVVHLKGTPAETVNPPGPNAVPAPEHSAGAEFPGPGAALGYPRLVDLGAESCIPCRMMAPILVELREKFAGRMAVEFIDVWKNPDAGHAYGIRMIPTQIFYDADGAELARHEGYMSKEDILAQWASLGIEFGPAEGEPRPAEPIEQE